MKKRYIVLLNSSVEEKDKEFLSFIKEHKLFWWHWLINSWLLIDSDGNLSTAQIRDKIKSIYGKDEDGYNLVIELKQQGEWAGFGPISKNRNMFTWIHKNWIKD